MGKQILHRRAIVKIPKPNDFPSTMVFSNAINVEMTLFDIGIVKITYKRIQTLFFGEYFVTFLGIFVRCFPMNFNAYELLIPCKLLIIDICQRSYSHLQLLDYQCL